MATRSVTSKIGNWFVAGAIGAGVGLLFAPHSGWRTRRLIRRKAQQYIRDAGDDVVEKTGDLYTWGKLAAGNTARRLRRKLNVAA